MKKWMAWLLAALMMLSLAACSASTTSTTTTEEQSTVVAAAEATAEPAAETASDTAAEKTAAPEETAAPTNEITFESFTAIDNDECSVTIEGIDPDSTWGYTIKAQLENKSAEKTYMFSVDSAYVNGVDANVLFASEVSPGQTASGEISLVATDLAEHGITDFTDIELFFRVYDSNDWSANPAAEESVHVYPYGEDKATTFVYTQQPTDQILADNDKVTVIATGTQMDSTVGYTVSLFIQNKTDKEILVSAEDESINGVMIDSWFAQSVRPGKCAFTSINWTQNSLDENGITAVESIAFMLRVYDYNNWLGADSFKDTVTVNP